MNKKKNVMQVDNTKVLYKQKKLHLWSVLQTHLFEEDLLTIMFASDPSPRISLALYIYTNLNPRVSTVLDYFVVSNLLISY